ncbi:NADH dehydrogenase [ubiquinone] 1 beta subcomplex subunit 1 [Anomaloglossus baeobatrachus]|uniref:NADH dehydrogenase [ubiquinone] 1 beta subcomplex subunit 1 n=1 Tax=Anomaloglossus baeobatrachus TaxID=238106 RepID=UPI003F5041A4
MVNIVALLRDSWMYAVLPFGVTVGYYLDKWNDSKMTLYKNKSRLFQRELKPNEEAWK